ncbi:mechanosensitive ion channel protein 10 [Spinacia oleracea]|uniref:Mechanosensitive ion channel protein 10 n=1 Tax=Spinacia oleracea TaxID=3562 RepID=A0A9R0I022_SPIOL|nr:mechanosensitive ion channel protein 10-like [Spinacia oleracea]
MDNQQLPKKESEQHDSVSSAKSGTNTSSHEIQPEGQGPTATRRQTSHTTVKISDDVSASSSASAQKKGCSCFQVVCNVVYYVEYLLFLPIVGACYLCVAGLVGVILAVILGLLISCSVIAATAALPLLLVSFLVIRLIQFFRHGDAYDKAIQLKLFIRSWILLDMAVFLVVLWIFFSAPKYVSGLKHVMLLGLTLADWVRLYFVIFGIYFLSCFVTVITINLLPLVLLGHTESGLKLPETVLEIFDSLIFWWAESEVMKRVAAFRHHKILGLYTQKWIEVSIFVLIAYNVITLSTYMVVWLLRKLVCHKLLKPGINTKSPQYIIIEKFLRGRYLMYWANGMKRSINFILRSLLVLLTWVFYFGSHLNKTPQAKNILDFGTWTCLGVLICSFLWLIKTCVLLSWEACSVYNRLSSKILEGGKQLYFLGIIGRHNYDILNLLYECKEDEASRTYDTDDQTSTKFISHLFKTLFLTGVMTPFARYLSKLGAVDEWGDKPVNVKKLLRKQRKRVEHDLLMQEGRIPTLYCIQQVASYILTAKQTLLEEKYTCDILEILKSHSQDDDNRSIKENLKRLILGENYTDDETVNSSEETPEGKNDWSYFEDQLQEYVGSSQEISLEKVRIWMERARKNCLLLANTLSSAKEVVDCLNKIISWLLIVATFIMWLLLTGLASTKVLVLIASPLLAATFIFGDACKTLFQGIMFAYVVHPFDVGDLCVIDGNMIEVKTIGVWKTTFLKVGLQEEVMYPNSELSSKNIINYKTDFDWNDYVELDVASLGERKIKILKQEIEKYLDDGEKDIFTAGYNCVEVLTTAENIKIAINFRHNVKVKNSTYFECLREKRKRRSEFVLHAQSLVYHMKNGTPEASEKHEEQVKAKNGSLMSLLNSGGNDTFVAGQVEGVYGG